MKLRRRRGAVLPVALLLLFLLSLFAACLASIVSLERAASANYVLGVKARLAAEAGVARAAADLRSWAGQRIVAAPGETWVFDKPGGGRADLATCEPERCSIFATLGRSSATTDLARVKIVDASSKVHLNDRRASLARVLDALGRFVQRSRGRDPVGGRGAALIARREARGGAWERADELESDARAIGASAEDVALLLEFATLHASVDATACEPKGGDADPPAVIASPSAPLDANLASEEAIAAAIASVEGRARVARARSVEVQPVDRGTRDAWPAVEEETTYSCACDQVSIGPVSDEVALAVARAIVAARPIPSRAHLASVVAAAAERGDLDAIPVSDASAERSRRARGSLIVAAIDPNARPAALVPSAPLGGPVDRASLVRRAGSGALESAVGLDLDVAPGGIFEVTSIGQVVGKDSVVLAERVVRVEVEAFATVRATSQRDFARAGARRAGVATAPENEARFAPSSEGPAEADPAAGWLELAPRDASSTAGPGAGVPTLRATWGRAGRANPYDADDAETSRDAYGEAAASPGRLARDGGRLVSDGVAMPAWSSDSLLFRAAAHVAGLGKNGPSAETGNVGMKRGSLELWWKPDFDWSREDGSATELFCGLVCASHVRPNPAEPRDETAPTRGTQMFLFRNTRGELRATRLYFEVVGSGGEQRPLVHDVLRDQWITIDEYVSRANASVRVTKRDRQDEARIGARQRTGDVIRTELLVPETTTVEHGWGYRWPPNGIIRDDEIAFARREVVIPFEPLRALRRGEWHHVAVLWDDGDVSANGLRLIVDGRELAATPHALPEDPSEELFCRLNMTPGEPQDALYVGRIVREQQVQGEGVVKYVKRVNEPCHGTIGSVRVSNAPASILDPPERFPRAGTFTLPFDVPRDRDGSASLLAVAWSGFLPTTWGAVDGAREAPSGAGAIRATVDVDGDALAFGAQERVDAPAGFGLGGRVLRGGGKLALEIGLDAAEFAPDGLAVASPAVDEITLRYAAGAPRRIEIAPDGDDR